ncbi:MAG: hypothetical protein GY751_01605 [Bacteroidetes bacterium]|nr:hypothetical protein [Bacteroidota bacterium]
MMNKLVLCSLLLALVFAGCDEDIDISTPVSLPTITVTNAPELIMVDEKVGTILVEFEVDGDQSLASYVLVSLDAAGTTAENGVDFEFEEVAIHIPAYIKYGSFTIDIIDNPIADKNNFLTINMGPYIKAPTVSNTASTRIEIMNFEVDEIQMINDWGADVPLSFDIVNTVASGGVDSWLWATGVNANNEVTGFTWDFIPDTTFMENGDTLIEYETENWEIDPCDIDFDVYYYDDLGGYIAANWNSCPEISYVTEDPGNGYIMNDDDSGGDVAIPYGKYTATLDNWSNPYSINNYSLLGTVFAGFHVVNLQADYPTNIEVTSTFDREGFFNASAVTSVDYFNIGNGGAGFLGGAAGVYAEQPIYTVDLQPGIVTVDYIDGTNIVSGRVAQPSFEHPVKEQVRVDMSNLSLNIIE